MIPSFNADEFNPNGFARDSKLRGLIEAGSELNFPVLLARGERPGPTLVVSANVHGDEYEGVRAIFDVFEELEPECMAGEGELSCSSSAFVIGEDGLKRLRPACSADAR